MTGKTISLSSKITQYTKNSVLVGPV